MPRGRRAVAFGTGDGGGGDAVRQVLRQVCGEGGEGGLFGAAGVADDGFGRELRGEGAADGRQGGDGGGDEDEIRAGYALRVNLRVRAVDEAV